MDWTMKLRRLEQMADRFRVMSDPTRLQILLVLGDREMSVQDLCECTGFKQSNVSKHLKVLREIQAVTCEQRGHYHYYRVIDPQILCCWRCTKTACNEAGETHAEVDSKFISNSAQTNSPDRVHCEFGVSHLASGDRLSSPYYSQSQRAGTSC